MKKTIILLILILFAISIYFYPMMPGSLVTHWNATGEPNGYMPKFWGVFLLPFVTLIITVFLLVLPKIDPLKKNIEKFRNYFDGFVAVLIMFMIILQVNTILWNMGIIISINVLLPLALGFLFFFTGILLKHCERNWFIGVRTPWTLSSDKVWRKTNQLGGLLFRISGIISIIGVFFKDHILIFTVFPVILSALIAVIYSYIKFRKEKH